MTILPETGAAQTPQTRIAKVEKAATFIGKRLGDRVNKAILKSAAADSKKLPGTTAVELLLLLPYGTMSLHCSVRLF